jgi:hypothetical protein
METNLSRRQLLKLASISLALIPVVSIPRQARAGTNAALRSQLKYQDTPKDDMICATCLEFVSGKSDKDLGGCKVIPGDTEISPNGYCVSWNTM